MRITVYDVLGYLASGMSHEEILSDFPYLEEEDILASLAFAADIERRFMAEPSLRLLFNHSVSSQRVSFFIEPDYLAP
jgi:hypothetical protein